MTDNEALADYIDAHIDAEEAYMERLYRDTWLYRLYPRMCSGHQQGVLLTMLATMIRPRRVLELGTFTGYSALALAKGMAEDGELHSVEIDDEHAHLILEAWERSPYASRMHLHIGDALEVVPRLEEQQWDLVFIDANKRHYPQYYDIILPRVVPGGYIFADNTLWDGKVTDPAEARDPQCKGIMDFNDLVANDDMVEKVIIPIRDGLTIIRKKP